MVEPSILPNPAAKDKSQRTRAKGQRPKAKGQRPRAKGQRPRIETLNAILGVGRISREFPAVAKRGVRLVLGLIVMAVLVSLAAVALMYVAVGRAPSVQRDSTLVLRLDDDLHEVAGDGVVQQLLEGSKVTGLPAVLEHLRKAKADPRVMKAQVLLARARFSPGQIDAKDGENFQKALSAFQQANGLTVTGKLEELSTDKKVTATKTTKAKVVANGTEAKWEVLEYREDGVDKTDEAKQKSKERAAENAKKTPAELQEETYRNEVDNLGIITGTPETVLPKIEHSCSGPW